jgi:RNA-directed DNA polymerase
VESKVGNPLKLPTVRDWRGHFRSRGLRDEVSSQYIAYIRPLVQRAVPVVFDFTHLAALLGRTPEYLAKATASPEHFYRTFQIPKKSGGFRQISAPYPSLKECQQWIASEILLRRHISPSATAYGRGKSILAHVDPHLSRGSSFLIVDLKDFFPSISKKRVIGWFHSLGYNYEVAIALASLCCVRGSLPQGSPASPHLSNLVASALDHRLEAIASHFGLKYTRYADDLCFSGSGISGGLLPLVRESVRRSGFALNDAKTRFHSPNSTSKIVTGINISTGSRRLPRKRRRDLSHTMHFIESFGYLSHKLKMKITDPKYLLRLRGNLEFWRYLEPDNDEVLGYISQIAQLQRLHGDG